MDADTAFQKFNREAPMLQHFNPEKLIIRVLQTDAGSFAIAGILNLYDGFGILRPILRPTSRRCTPKVPPSVPPSVPPKYHRSTTERTTERTTEHTTESTIESTTGTKRAAIIELGD